MPLRTSPPHGRHLYTVCRIMLGAVFIYASWDKVIHPAAFAEIVANYQILPQRWVGPVALTLPWIELICGTSLVVHRWAQGGALLATSMMLVFMGALGYNAVRGMDVACGCFTLDASAPASVWVYLLRDAVILAMAVYVLIGRREGRRSPAAA